ncbi:MAG: hypothetical protein AAGA30_05040 [Planctomycetota bacterium]
MIKFFDIARWWKRWTSKSRFLFEIRQRLKGKSYAFKERRISEKPWGYDRISYVPSILFGIALSLVLVAVLLPSYNRGNFSFDWLSSRNGEPKTDHKLKSFDDVAMCLDCDKLMEFGNRIPFNHDAPIEVRVKNHENRLLIANRLALLSDADHIKEYILAAKLESGFALHRLNVVFDVPAKTKFRRLVELAEDAEAHPSANLQKLGKLVSACLYCNRLQQASNSEKDLCQKTAKQAIRNLAQIETGNWELVDELVDYLNELRAHAFGKEDNFLALSQLVSQAFGQDENSMVKSAVSKLYRDL